MFRHFLIGSCVVLPLLWAPGCRFDAAGLRILLDTEVKCGNGVDDDGDGWTDCSDGDCAGDPACNQNNNNNSASSEHCDNGLDDDGDTFTDCADPDCSSLPGCQPEDCTNGVDDNGDGAADCEDPDCSAELSCQPEDCTNGVDDNGDGATDCDDAQCSGAVNCQPEDCANGVDDNANGLVDCDEETCLGTPTCGDCHPITNEGCATGTCYLHYLVSWFGECYGGSGSGTQWDWCDGSADDCAPGYYCSGSTSECYRVCRPGTNDCSAVGGGCHPFSDLFNDSPWGVCY